MKCFFMPKIQILTHKFTKYVTFIKMNFWRKNGLLEQCVLLLHNLVHVLWQTRWKSGSFTRIPPISNQKGSWTLQEFFSRSDASSIFLGCRGSGGKSVGSAKNHFIELLLHYALLKELTLVKLKWGLESSHLLWLAWNNEPF